MLFLVMSLRIFRACDYQECLWESSQTVTGGNGWGVGRWWQAVLGKVTLAVAMSPAAL